VPGLTLSPAALGEDEVQKLTAMVAAEVSRPMNLDVGEAITMTSNGMETWTLFRLGKLPFYENNATGK
jgi:hypothetical protein